MKINKTIRRPIVRYHGGKWREAEWIAGHFPAHRVFVETHCGGASVFVRKQRSYAEVINDIDGEIVNIFRVMQDPVKAAELRRLLEVTPFARAEFERAREEAPAGDDLEMARRTIIRSFMGFGSGGIMREHSTGFRANSNRSGSTPAHDWANYPRCLAAYCQRLQGVVIECRPALEIIDRFDGPETLFYVDPPYLFSTRYSGAETSCVYRHEMSVLAHARLAKRLNLIKGMAVVSGYPSALYDRLFKGWRRVEKSTHADGAKKRVEALWLSPGIEIQPELISAD